MKWLSERLTGYIVKSGAISEESYVVYQYGFQIGLEMLCCFVVCLGVAVYLHMILEFFVFTGIFMSLRTYAGGLHLNSFVSCFVCSVFVQTAVLLLNSLYVLPLSATWIATVLCVILIWKLAPVESVNRKLDSDEKKHCKKVTAKIAVGILVFTSVCTVVDARSVVSLITMTVTVIAISQYIGIVKYKIEKKK